jgi:hypothetical protein
MQLTRRDILRFWVKVRISSNPKACWEWKAGKRGNYGAFKLNGKVIDAHCIAFALANGNITPECVCHTCDNPPCCNPFHLYAGTKKTNANDREVRGRQVHKPTRKCSEEGKAWCYICQACLPVEDFWKAKSTWNGLYSACKRHDNHAKNRKK